jgi:phosphoglycerate kinase
MDKLTIRDADVAGKRVFVRVDFNVPLADGKVTDDSRIRAAIPTILTLVHAGARVILASHLGRPNGKVSDSLRLRPVGQRLTELLRRNVPVTGDALGLGTEDALKRMRPGEILLLENLRFHAEEEANDPAFAATLASYADIYVNDAFGSAHRAHASTVGVPKLLPAYAGLLMERELTMLSKLLEAPERPFAAILGGAKVSDKIRVIDHLLTKVDLLVLGGGMANTFLLAQGKAIGKSLAEPDRVQDAQRILATAEKNKVRVVLPVDVIVAKEVTRGTEYKTLPAEKIPASWHIVDLGKASQDQVVEALNDVKTVFWNGPLGVFEIPSFAHGTNAVARLLADRAEHGATVVIGGGDSVASITQQGLADKMTHISTGGGASLEFLEGRELPGVTVLLDRPQPPKPASKPKAPSKPKAAAKAVAKPAARATKPAAKAVAKPAAKATKPAAKASPSKPAAKAAAKPAAKASQSKPAAKAAAKPAAKATKPAAKASTPKPAAKAPTKPAASKATTRPTRPRARTEKPA